MEKAKKEDRRIRKTKANLKEALTGLLLERELKDISVKELAAVADVNRGTFYLHYRDMDDLYEQLQQEIYEEIRSIFSKHLSYNRRAGLLPVVTELFELLAKNRKLCTVVLNSQDTDLLPGIIEMGKPSSREDWTALLGAADPKLYEYHYAFITAGCVGLIRTWFAGGMKEPPEQMAQLAGHMLNRAYID